MITIYFYNSFPIPLRSFPFYKLVHFFFLKVSIFYLQKANWLLTWHRHHFQNCCLHGSLTLIKIDKIQWKNKEFRTRLFNASFSQPRLSDLSINYSRIRNTKLLSCKKKHAFPVSECRSNFFDLYTKLHRSNFPLILTWCICIYKLLTKIRQPVRC